MKQKLKSKLNCMRENKKTNLRQDFFWISNKRWKEISSAHWNKRAMTARGQGPHQGGFSTPRGTIQENSLWFCQAHPNKFPREFQRPFNALKVHKKRQDTKRESCFSIMMNIKKFSKFMHSTILRYLLWAGNVVRSPHSSQWSYDLSEVTSLPA